MIKTLTLSKSSLDSIQELGYNYTLQDDNILVNVEDLDYNYDHSLIDPDEQLCFQYGINYNHLIKIV